MEMKTILLFHQPQAHQFPHPLLFKGVYTIPKLGINA